MKTTLRFTLAAALLLFPLILASPVTAADAADGPASVPPLEEQLVVEGTAVPQMGKPDPRDGFCRLTCGLRCADSTDCPGGVPCDAFITCPVEVDAGSTDSVPLPSLEEQLRPEPSPASVCGFFPVCRNNSVCVDFCGQFGLDGSCVDGCCGCLG